MMNRNFFSIMISYTKVVIAFLALIPAAANALIIILEPDDYGMDVPLQNEYVRVGVTGGAPFDSPIITPLTAKKPSESREGYEAPTGELTFGNYPFVSPFPGYNWAGIVFDFNQAVSQVTLLAKDLDVTHGGASWIAFDAHGGVIQRGNVRGSGGRHLPYQVNIPLENVWRVIVGGEDSIPLTDFDYLTFEVPDVSVPEPPSLIMLLMSLGFLVLVRMRLTYSEAKRKGISLLALTATSPAVSVYGRKEFRSLRGDVAYS